MSFLRSAAVFLDGMSRCAKERYRVRLMDEASGVARGLPSPSSVYYADPFLFARGDERWIFVEAFRCTANRGEIAVARIGRDLTIDAPVRAIDTGCHASFPFVFEHAGAVYMVPETSNAHCVDLYVCEAMPDRWRRAARLLDAVDCADSVLYRRAGVWYLVTSQSDAATSPRRWLAIYCAETLEGRWTPHPVNRERRYADRAHGYGRNAGGIVETAEGPLRPMQASTRYYGEAARAMRILALTPEHFEEAPYEGEHAIGRIASSWSTHHVSVCGSLVAWDTRTRAGYFGSPPERRRA